MDTTNKPNSGISESCSKLLQEISTLTLDIETNHPELYQFLDEEPMTIPSENHPTISEAELTDYLNALKDKLAKYLDNNPKVKQV